VPNLIGLSQTAATSALTGAGLRLGLVSKVVDCNNLGIVLHQNPAAGTTVLAASAIDITVGSRPALPRVCP
jgi:beta-lactam-binding protein with PASTA domain